jgi:D-3-phosphoglycerate dehydrogenase
MSLLHPPPLLQVTRAVFEASKGRLKVVGRAGVGIDNVDLAAASEVCVSA